MKSKLDFFIIDDSDVNNYYTEDLLEEFDFTNSVSTFLRAQEGLTELMKRVDDKKAIPHVIFLDIRMPEMDGFEFIEELEYQLEDRVIDTKIFILTSSKHRRDVEAYEKQSIACEFLNKPLDKSELLTVLEKHFGE